MGCDIKAFIEYDGPFGYRSFDHPHIQRYYELFQVLAGVRGCKLEPVVPPRGFPIDAAGESLEAYTLLITDDEPEEDEDGVVSREKAAKLLEEEESEPWDDDRITNPDVHTPSWLSTEEVAVAFARFAEASPGLMPPELDGILAAMKALPGARLVFFFDN